MIQRVPNALLYDKTILDFYFLLGNIIQKVISILFPVWSRLLQFSQEYARVAHVPKWFEQRNLG